MLLFIALCFVRCFRYFCRALRHGGCADERYVVFALSLPMVLCILGNNIVETNFVLMGANFFQAVFWFVAGICVLCVTQARKEKE
jgi:hypothetical protein